MIINVLGFFFCFFFADKRLGFNAMTHAQQVYLKVKIRSGVMDNHRGDADTCSDVFELCWKGIVATID